MRVSAALLVDDLGPGGVFASYIVGCKIEIRMRVDYSVVKRSPVLEVQRFLVYILERQFVNTIANLCVFVCFLYKHTLIHILGHAVRIMAQQTVMQIIAGSLMRTFTLIAHAWPYSCDCC